MAIIRIPSDQRQDPRQTLALLYLLMGPKAVLLPIPLGSKRPVDREWQRITFAQTQTKTYQARLLACITRSGNIGVLLGPASGGLASIDLDNDPNIAVLLRINPKLANTTRTRGQRGGQFWMHPKGQYPNGQAVYEIKDAQNEHVGEWRCGGGSKGAQSIVFGIHPDTGKPYQILVAVPAIEINYSEIIWPNGWHLVSHGTNPREPRRTSGCVYGAPPVLPDLGPPTDRDDRRIRAYLDRVPPAISHHGGHNRTFRTACLLINDWGLTVAQARPYMDIYSERCEPPWSDSELRHKLNDAAKEIDARRGHLRREGE